jgi:hypothetical protein
MERELRSDPGGDEPPEKGRWNGSGDGLNGREERKRAVRTGILRPTGFHGKAGDGLSRGDPAIQLFHTSP